MLQLVNAHHRNGYSLMVNVLFEQGDKYGNMVGRRFLEINQS
jgi:hypothetical protein